MMNALRGDAKTKGRETQRQYRSSSLTQRTPLFSRFHVNDAGKPGLTSNKMAFHEQFTVSIQRFRASCRPSTAPFSCSEECGLKECHRLSAVPMPVAVTCPKTQGVSCPFFGTATVCDNKFTGSYTVSNMAVLNAKGDKLKNTATKPADAHLASDRTPLDKAKSNDGQPVCNTSTADTTKLVKGAHSISIGDRLQNVYESRRADLASQSEGHAIVSCEDVGDAGKINVTDKVPLTLSKPYQDTPCKEHDRALSSEYHSQHERHAVVGCDDTGDAGKIIVRDEVPLMVSKCYQDTSCKEHDRALSKECYSDSYKIEKVSHVKGSEAEEVVLDRPISNDVGKLERHTGIDKDYFGCCRAVLSDDKCACSSLVDCSSKEEVETGVAIRETEAFPKPLEDLSIVLDVSGRENAGNTTSNRPCFPARSKCEASGESATKNGCSCQEDVDIENGLNDQESCLASSLSPKAVIQEIGQLKFWKARLALIRQQRIFSEQVFELHKLIEVQRLLAGTPQASIDEIYFGVGNMNLECNSDAFASNNYLIDNGEK